MNVQILHEGVDITNRVISYHREQRICDGTGTLDLEIQAKNPRDFSPYELVVLYEDGIKKGTYFISEVTKSIPDTVYHVSTQDASKQLVDYFITDEYLVDYYSTARYWISRFLDETGVNYHFTTSSTGGVLSNNTSLGMNSAYDTLIMLCQISGWYFYCDEENVCQIGRLNIDTGSVADSYSETDILQYKSIKHDRMLRNRAVVWGAGDALNDTWVFADIHVHTPYNYDTEDLRAVVFSNSFVSTYATAGAIAKLMLDEFSQINYEKTISIAGAQDLNLGDFVDIKTRGWSGTGRITTISSDMSISGLTTTITLDERCPRIFGYFDYGGYVYIGTNGSGVWRKPFDIDSWSDYSSGLTDLVVTDLFIKSGVFACVTETGKFFYKTLAMASWILYTPPSLIDNDEVVYPPTDLKAVACSINDEGIIQVVYNLINGLSPEMVLIGGIPYPVGAIRPNRSWVLEVSGLGTLVRQNKVIDGDNEDYEVIDIESNGSYNVLTTHANVYEGLRSNRKQQTQQGTPSDIFLISDLVKVFGPRGSETPYAITTVIEAESPSPYERINVMPIIDLFENMYWIGHHRTLTNQYCISVHNTRTGQHDDYTFTGWSDLGEDESVMISVTSSTQIELIRTSVTPDFIYTYKHYRYILGDSSISLTGTHTFDPVDSNGWNRVALVNGVVYHSIIGLVGSTLKFFVYALNLVDSSVETTKFIQIPNFNFTPVLEDYECDDIVTTRDRVVGASAVFIPCEQFIISDLIVYYETGDWWKVCIPGGEWWDYTATSCEIRTYSGRLIYENREDGEAAGVPTINPGFIDCQMGAYNSRDISLTNSTGSDPGVPFIINEDLGFKCNGSTFGDVNPNVDVCFYGDVPISIVQSGGDLTFRSFCDDTWQDLGTLHLTAIFGRVPDVIKFAPLADSIDNTIYIYCYGVLVPNTILGVSCQGVVIKTITGVSVGNSDFWIFGNYVTIPSMFGYNLYPLPVPDEQKGKVLVQSSPTTEGATEDTFTVALDKIPSAKVEINKGYPTMLYPKEGGTKSFFCTSATNQVDSFTEINTLAPFDARAYDTQAIDYFTKRLGVVETSVVKTFKEDFSNVLNLVTTAQLSATGEFSHLETTNFEPMGNHMFVSISGIEYSARFFEKGLYTTLFVNHSTNLPPTDITIIRTDDML